MVVKEEVITRQSVYTAGQMAGARQVLKQSLT